MESFLLEGESLQRCIQYYSMSAEWMISLICTSKRYSLMVAMDINSCCSPYLPLPDTPPMSFAGIPEFFIEDMIDFLVFCSR